MYFRTDNIMIDFSRVDMIFKEKNSIFIKFYESDIVSFNENEVSFEELLDGWQNRAQMYDDFVFIPLKKK